MTSTPRDTVVLFTLTTTR